MLREHLSFRLQVFGENLATIEEHTSRPDRTYDMGLTEFSDLTPEEFRDMYLHKAPPEVSPAASDTQVAVQSAPESLKGLDIDWVAKGVVTRVKNQGLCKADYAFAGIGAV